ncbi:MAG: SMP-30/gluconolactonase/LRE family protein [Bacteroidales bacterium]|nr:SMP-30/gluconolactonase/LRE family protein [Bacteroidales bacterium]
MTRRKNLILLSALLLFAVSLRAQTLDDIIAAGARVEKLADGFLFTEGPTPDSRGNVYFTDQPNDRIMVWSTAGKLTTFMQPCGRSNGLAFDSKGNLWSCADELNELWCIEPGKNVRVVVEKYDNKLLNGPNDLWISKSGDIYFTDPYYRRPWWKHKDVPQEIHGVYLLRAGQTSLIRVAEDLKQPNGIVGSPDGKKLYVADIGAGRTWEYTIDADGKLSGKKLFCEMGSDGMTVDTKGNLYLTGDGVTVFDKNGKKIGNIAVPEKWTANVCFGGSDMKKLFITASKGFYSIRLKVKGTRS